MKERLNMFSEIFAVCLLVENFDTSYNFYTKTLGLRENYRDGVYCDFSLNGTLIGIFEKNSATAMFSKSFMNNGGGVVIAFSVENFEESLEKLISKGVKIIEGPKTTDWGQTVAYFLDPDKNIIELSKKP